MVAKIRQRVHARSSSLEKSSSRSLRRPLNYKTYVFYGILVLGCALTATFLVLRYLNVLTPVRFVYAVMFDAGSSGSRMHIFQIRIRNGQYELGNETYDRVSPGLSDYAQNPEDGALSLKPLLDKALAIVPGSEYSSTGISLRATAGLRLLSRFQQMKLIEAVRDLFARYPFHVDHDTVSVMTGTDEGFYAWITVAFLLGHDMISNNIAALDLGGGSAQVTFAPEEASTLNMTEHIHRRIMPGGRHAEIYSHSYLGAGLLYARAEILKKSTISVNEAEIYVASPCMHPEAEDNSEILWNYLDYNYLIRGDSEGKFSFSLCYSIVREVVQAKNMFKPKELLNRDKYIMSYYFDRAVETGLIGQADDNKLLLVKDFRKRAEFECQGRSQGLILNEFLCMDLTYIYSLLHDGFGLPDTSSVQVVNRLRNSAVSWALGAALNKFIFHS